jgi:hypothetical protein
VYEIPQNEFEILNVLFFENENDQTIRTVNNYIKSYFPESVAIELLLPQKLKDQYAFRTNRAIDTLKFVEVKLA